MFEENSNVIKKIIQKGSISISVLIYLYKSFYEANNSNISFHAYLLSIKGSRLRFNLQW